MVTTGATGGVRGRVRRLFSPRAFLLALVACGVGVVVGSALPIPLLGGLGALLGVFAAGFVLGLGRQPRYAEVAVAGALAAGAALLTDFLVLSLVGGFGGQLALVGAGAGLVVGVLGHYFGRDLRSGLTRDLN
ncbi:MAG: hypothetical protein ABEJ70_00030 [Halobacteriaceae archaeon]